MLSTANDLFGDADNAALIIEPPEVWGVEALSADAVVVRLVVKTVPLQQWKVARLLREKIEDAFDEAGVEIPFPQRTVWVRTEGTGAEALAEAVQVGEKPPTATASEPSKGAPAGRHSGEPLDR